MGKLRFPRVLLLSVFLVTLLCNGSARQLTEEVVNASMEEQQNLREIELDYVYAGPNFNSKSSFSLPPAAAAAPPGLGF